MSAKLHPGVSADILEKTLALGASLAGITRVAKLKGSPSYAIYHHNPYYEGYQGVEWPEEAKSVLVMALVHDLAHPEMDWWDYKPGRTLGNRKLQSIATQVQEWLQDELGIASQPLPYRVEHGGVLLKDAAVLAGLGIIGRNNLVITPEFGPRVRLRAVFLNAIVESTGPIEFDPCETCAMPCRSKCPQGAFDNGAYRRALCDEQMGINKQEQFVFEGKEQDGSPIVTRKYCRNCELACSIGS